MAETFAQMEQREISAAHGVYKEKIDRSNISKLFVTDTIETQPEALSPKVEVVSVAPLFGDAIRRIHDRQSISVLFERIN